MFTNFFEIWKHECIAPTVLNMVTSFSNSEPRKSVKLCVMYRTHGAQHGYDVFNIGTSCFRNLWFRKHVEDAKHLIHERNNVLCMYRAFGIQHGYDVFNIGTSCFRNLWFRKHVEGANHLMHECIASSMLNMVMSSSNLEPRICIIFWVWGNF